MEFLNIIIVVSAFLLAALLWALIAKKQLQTAVSKLIDEGKILEKVLNKRQDLLPNLIETVRIYVKNQAELSDSLIEARSKATKIKGLNKERLIAEHELSRSVNRLIDLGRSFRELSMDTNFLELRKEINDLESELEEKNCKYNDLVRRYNKMHKSLFYKLWAMLFGFKLKNIFEIES